MVLYHNNNYYKIRQHWISDPKFIWPKHKNIDLILPRLALCGDNAAMIGMCAYYKIMSNTYNNDLEISAIPQYPLEDFSL